MAALHWAHDLLVRLGAPPRLITHARLVGEAAELLLTQLDVLGVAVDADFVRCGVILHDAGKILHPNELSHGGREHELAGETLLLAQGVDPALARCCRSHARWDAMPCSLEELLIALADCLWKGHRNAALEKRVIDAIKARTARDFWDLFVELDTCFESIASDATERLRRSAADRC